MNVIIEISADDYRVVQDIGISAVRVWTPTKATTVQVKSKRPPHRGVPLREYQPTLKHVMMAMGGRVDVYIGSPVYCRLEKILAKTAYDRALLPSGKHARWWNSVQWARHKMKIAGVIVANSPTGIWELA
jgi:hypothetical protein